MYELVKVCQRGRIYRTAAREKGVPDSIIRIIRSFVEETEYKGTISVPVGPYNSDIATQISRSLELIEKFGDLDRIVTIIIRDARLSVRLKPYVIADAPLTLDSNLKKIFSNYRRRRSKEINIT